MMNNSVPKSANTSSYEFPAWCANASAPQLVNAYRGGLYARSP
jgi:hypothetical protein